MPSWPLATKSLSLSLTALISSALLRGHGESGGEYTTYGALESRDVKAVMDRSFGQMAEQKGLNFGVDIREGVPATIRRELESLSRRYLDATDEILLWLEPRTT